MDAAINVSGAESLDQALAGIFPGKSAFWRWGILDDKDGRGILEALAVIPGCVCHPPGRTALAVAGSAAGGSSVNIYRSCGDDSIEDAVNGHLNWSERMNTIINGSFMTLDRSPPDVNTNLNELTGC